MRPFAPHLSLNQTKISKLRAEIALRFLAPHWEARPITAGPQLFAQSKEVSHKNLRTSFLASNLPSISYWFAHKKCSILPISLTVAFRAICASRDRYNSLLAWLSVPPVVVACNYMDTNSSVDTNNNPSKDYRFCPDSCNRQRHHRTDYMFCPQGHSRRMDRTRRTMLHQDNHMGYIHCPKPSWEGAIPVLYHPTVLTNRCYRQ